MKIEKYSFVLFVCLFVTLSCSKRELVDKGKKYKIDISKVEESNLSLLTDSVYYVVLETNQSNPIGEIAKLKVDDYITLLDRVSNTIQIYSLTGKFIMTISHIGNGPGEYVRISDFIVYPDREEIDVLDGMQNKIIRYTFMGELVAERKVILSSGISRFSILDSCYIFDQQLRGNKVEDRYNLVQTSFEGAIVSQNLPYKQSFDVVLSSRNSLFFVNDTLVYLPTYSSIAYNVIGTGVEPRYFFDFGNQCMDEEYLYSTSKNPMAFVNGLKDTHGIYFFNVNESYSHLFLDFMYKNEKYYAVIKKKNSLIRLFKASQEKGCTMKNFPFTSFGDYFVIPVDRHEAPKQFLKDGEEDNNPVLMFVKFK